MAYMHINIYKYIYVYISGHAGQRRRSPHMNDGCSGIPGMLLEPCFSIY